MRRITIFFITLTLSVAALAQQRPIAHNDPRTEVVSILCRLAGFQEYSQCYFPGYASEVDAYFAPVRDHAAVKMLREELSGSMRYDKAMNVALYSPIIDGQFATKDSVLWGADENVRNNERILQRFLTSCNGFIAESHFWEFFEGHKPFYAKVEAAMQANLDLIDMEWFDNYFQMYAHLEKHVYVSTLNGPSNYGIKPEHRGDTTHLSVVMGCCFPSQDGEPAYQTATLVPIIVHEFCHSYCNPLCDKYYEAMKRPLAKVFDKNARLLSAQAYPHPLIMSYETFVRASVIFYMEQHFPNYSAADPLANEEELGFILAPTILDALRDRDLSKYPSMESYMPVLIERINAFSIRDYYRTAKVADRKKAHVKGCKLPQHAGEGEIVIRFDKPMADHLALYSGNTGDPFPTLSERRPYYEWSKDQKTLTLYVKLAPGRYAFSVYKGFVTADGNPLSKVMFYDFEVK